MRDTGPGPDGAPPLPPSRFGGLPSPSPSLSTKKSNGFLAKAGRSIGIGRKPSEKNLKSSKSSQSISNSHSNSIRPPSGSNSFASPSPSTGKEVQKERERAFDEQIRNSSSTKRILPGGGSYVPLTQPDLPDSQATSTSTSPMRSSLRLKRDSISFKRGHDRNTSSPGAKVSSFESQPATPNPFGLPDGSEQSPFVTDLGLPSPTSSSPGPTSIAAIRRAAAGVAASSSDGHASGSPSQHGLVSLRPDSEVFSKSTDSSQSAAAAIVAAYKNSSSSSIPAAKQEEPVQIPSDQAEATQTSAPGVDEIHARSDLKEGSNSRPSSRGGVQPASASRSISRSGSTEVGSSEFYSAQPSPASAVAGFSATGGSLENSSLKSSTSQNKPTKSPARKPLPPLESDSSSAEKPQLSEIPPVSPIQLTGVQKGILETNQLAPQQFRQEQTLTMRINKNSNDAPPFAQYLPSPVGPEFPVGVSSQVSHSQESTREIPTSSSSVGHGDDFDSVKGHSRKPSRTERFKASVAAALNGSRSSSRATDRETLASDQVDDEVEEVRDGGEPVSSSHQLVAAAPLVAPGVEDELAPATPPKTQDGEHVKTVEGEPLTQDSAISSHESISTPQASKQEPAAMLSQYSHLNQDSSSKDLFNALQEVQSVLAQLEMIREEEKKVYASLCQRAAEEIERLQSSQEEVANSIVEESTPVEKVQLAPLTVRNSQCRLPDDLQTPPADFSSEIRMDVTGNEEPSQDHAPEEERVEDPESSGFSEAKAGNPSSLEKGILAEDSESHAAEVSEVEQPQEESTETLEEDPTQKLLTELRTYGSLSSSAPKEGTSNETEEALESNHEGSNPTEESGENETTETEFLEEPQAAGTNDSSLSSELSTFPSTPNGPGALSQDSEIAEVRTASKVEIPRRERCVTAGSNRSGSDEGSTFTSQL